MDHRALKNKRMCCRANAAEVRFYAAELELGIKRAEPLKPAEVIWRTLTENLFSPNPLFYMIEYWVWFYFLWKSGLMWKFLFFSMFRMWQALEGSSSVSSKSLQGMPYQPRERQNPWNNNEFPFSTYICFLKINHSIFFFL